MSELEKIHKELEIARLMLEKIALELDYLEKLLKQKKLEEMDLAWQKRWLNV